MSLKKLISAVAFATTLASASASQAAISSFGIDLGSVLNGETGEFTQIGKPGDFINFFSGQLTPGLRIDFDYSLDVDSGPFSLVVTNSFYDYTDNGHHYEGTRISDSSPADGGGETVDGVNSPTQLLVATAGLNHASVTNNSKGTVTFIETLEGIISAIGSRTFHISYVVSSVPLPAMAPLFGAALAGLGFAARRKAKAAA